MSYDTNKLTQVLALKKLAQRVQSRISVIESSVAANVTASTDNDADYAAELVDARIDSTGTPHASAGANVRYWQGSLTDANELLQDQINELSEGYLEMLTQFNTIQIRQVRLKEVQEANEALQEQINQISECYLEILTQLGSIQSNLRELQN